MKTSSLTWRWKAVSHKQLLLGRTTYAVSHVLCPMCGAARAKQVTPRNARTAGNQPSIKQTPGSTAWRSHAPCAAGYLTPPSCSTREWRGRCRHIAYTVLPSGAARATASDPMVVATPEGKQQPCSIEARSQQQRSWG